MTKQIKQRWNTVLKSGNRALEVVIDAIEHVKEHGDTSLIANMIYDAERLDMPVYAKRLRKITGLVFTEAKVRKNKEGRYSITRGDGFNASVVVTLEAARDEGFSLIGPKLGELIGEKKETLSQEEEFAKRCTSFAKWIAKSEGVSLEQAITALRAEYAKAAALKAVA